MASAARGVDACPEGESEPPLHLRILVVDDDPLCLLVVTKQLERCQHQVTKCTRGLEALRLLREASPPFHLVLSDVDMPDMDGYRLLEQLGLEMEVPVIMMSADGETSAVLKGMLHGAVDYLQKPIQMSDLRYIWQHVIRRDRAVEQPPEGRGRGSGGGARVGKEKRSKAAVDGEEDEEPEEAPSGGGGKKARVVWAMELHGRFVEAVNVLGVDKAVPKRILELMGVQGLTRENVASHLQKYRLYLKRVQTMQSEQRAAERRATGSMARSTASPPQHMAAGYQTAGFQHAHHGGSYGFHPPPVEAHFWAPPMDAFEGALRKFDVGLGADLAPFEGGCLPPPPGDPAAHAAIAQLDFSIGNGLSLRGLGGSMTALDALVPSPAVSEDALLQQFLHAALIPGDGLMN